jgi:hypothetical protein
VVLVIIGFVAMRVKLGKLNRYKLKIHDGMLTITYLLLLLSLPHMVNFAYFSFVHGNTSPLILTHSLVGIIVVVIGFIFVINKGSLKLKRAWKTKRNMQTLSALWIINFILGIFVLGSLFHH